MSRFVLEIGTEELPARLFPALEEEYKELFMHAIYSMGYTSLELVSYSTPRRLVLDVHNIPEIQPSYEEVVIGPPVKVAFDSHNRPTKAATGFATMLGTDVDKLIPTKTDKGEYLSGIKKIGGAITKNVLAELCPTVITKLSFPKKMRWSVQSKFAFGRPIRWIFAVLDNEVISFEIAGINSDRITYGHRSCGFGPFNIQDVKEYAPVLENKGMIVLDRSARRKHIVAKATDLAKKVGGEVLWKDSLLSEIEYLVEYPHPIMGSINEKFLELPQEVLLTSMEIHQKSFGIVDHRKKLLPYFLTVANIMPPNESLVQKGWEKVLRARLEDAQFFWESDSIESLDVWHRKLEQRIFLEPLGSMAQKTQRISKLCVWMAEQTGKCSIDDAHRAGMLSKTDLVSKMVGEFESLQGIMGSIYAKKQGESKDVVAALKEQYLPAGPDDTIPISDLGAMLSISDKIDTLIGCFGLGMIPTGTADPYALRRNALGICRIILEKGYSIRLKELLYKAQEVYGNSQIWAIACDNSIQKLYEFFITRIKNYFVRLGYETVVVEAVLGAENDDIYAVKERLTIMVKLMQEEAFDQIVYTLKRVVNIVKKHRESSEITLDGTWDSSLLKEHSEKIFAEQLVNAFIQFSECENAKNIQGQFDAIINLNTAINAFFDTVMIMCDDKNIQKNRLNMLQALLLRMEQLADFSALQI